MYTFYELHTNIEDFMVIAAILATPFSVIITTSLWKKLLNSERNQTRMSLDMYR